MNPVGLPTSIVIFGITGDLARRKLLPALYRAVKDGLLHEATDIVGVSRGETGNEVVLANTRARIMQLDGTCDEEAFKKFADMLHMYKMDLVNSGDYSGLRTHLDQLEAQHGICMNRLYYLAIPPQVFEPVVANFGKSGLNEHCPHGTGQSHLLVEKPFGFDTASAEELVRTISAVFAEEQVFRIDHYLAKETVQNILTFRAANPIFEPLWNNQYIRSIRIVAEEKIGIEGRAAFYEQIGALRDFVQSHLLQLLAITTMEVPHDITSDTIHAAKLSLLEAIEPVPADKVTERVFRAQYEGYRSEVGKPDSNVETYVELELYINSPRWQRVPIRLRTGKGLAETQTSISITFGKSDSESTNVLTFSIQPNESIGIDLCAKRPGFEQTLQRVAMDFTYARSFASDREPDAYERVLVDALRSDHSLFATSAEVLTSWRILQPVLDAWAKSAKDLAVYPIGSAHLSPSPV